MYIILKETAIGIEKALRETFETLEEAQQALAECSAGCFIHELTSEDM